MTRANITESFRKAGSSRILPARDTTKTKSNPMATISFQLINKEQAVLKTTPSLLSMWDYIRMYVNVPQNWMVEEIENGEMIDSVNACYLTEAFKSEKELPLSIQDIN